MAKDTADISEFLFRDSKSEQSGVPCLQAETISTTSSPSREEIPVTTIRMPGRYMLSLSPRNSFVKSLASSANLILQYQDLNFRNDGLGYRVRPSE